MPRPTLGSARDGAEGRNGACVEVALAGRVVGVRDSKDPHSPVLAFTPESWTAFARSVRAGRFAA